MPGATHSVAGSRRPDPGAHGARVITLSPEARHRLGFAAVASAMIVAGGLVAAINGATPFAHGSWLAAYLVLVGGVAQLLLGFGWLALPAASASARLRDAQLGLWNAGMLAVAGGVLSELPGLVFAGSAVFAGALMCFLGGSGSVHGTGRGRVLVYRAVVGLLFVSIVVGAVLAATNHNS